MGIEVRPTNRIKKEKEFDRIVDGFLNSLYELDNIYKTVYAEFFLEEFLTDNFKKLGMNSFADKINRINAFEDRIYTILNKELPEKIKIIDNLRFIYFDKYDIPRDVGKLNEIKGYIFEKLVYKYLINKKIQGYTLDKECYIILTAGSAEENSGKTVDFAHYKKNDDIFYLYEAKNYLPVFLEKESSIKKIEWLIRISKNLNNKNSCVYFATFNNDENMCKDILSLRFCDSGDIKILSRKSIIKEIFSIYSRSD